MLSGAKEPFLGKHDSSIPVQSVDHSMGKLKILSRKILKSF